MGVEVSTKYRTIISSYLWLNLLNLINVVIPYFITIYLVSTLGLKVFGQLAFSMSIAAAVFALSDFGISTALLRRGSKAIRYGNIIKWHLKNSIKIRITVSMIFMSAAFCFSYYIKNLEVAYVTLLVYGVFIGNIFSSQWLYTISSKLHIYTIVFCIKQIMLFFLVLKFVSSEHDLTNYAGINCILSILSGLLLFVVSYKLVESKVSPSKNVCFTKYVYSSYKLYISNIMSSLQIAGIPIVIGILSGDSQVGLYSSVEKLVTGIKGLIITAFQVLLPKSVIQTTWVKQSNLVLKKYGTYTVLIISLVLILFSTEIVNLIYDGGYYAEAKKLLIYMLAILPVSYLVQFNLFYKAVASGNYDIRMIGLSASSIWILIFSVPIIYYGDAKGGVLVYIFSEIIMFSISEYFFVRQQKYITQLN